MGIRHGRALALLAAALATAALMPLPALSASPVNAPGAADSQASAMVALINGERAYRGKPALGVDSFLMSKARDGSIWCPNDSLLVMDGRAKDMADNSYSSHALRRCPTYTIIDAMATWGYTGGRGEIISYNSAGVHSVTYAYGCTPSIAACPGSSTIASDTVAQSMAFFMRSSVHYSIITGNYSRVGCGAWVSSGGVYYYACLFALGGNPIVTPKPAPGATGGASPSEPAAYPSEESTQVPWPTPRRAGGPLVMLDAPATTSPATTSPAMASPDVAVLESGAPAAGSQDSPTPDAGAPGGASSGAPDDSPAGLTPVAEGALAVGGAAATLLLAWLGLLRRRPRRPKLA